MTSSVLPPFSSNVTVVTGPPSPPSSLVHTRRECGVTSRYVPKNAIASDSNSRRYLPPTRTSISQERRDMPIDFGNHHRVNSSGLVHASNTLRAGPAQVRVRNSSPPDPPPRERLGLGPRREHDAGRAVEGAGNDQLTLGPPLHRRAVLHGRGLT